MHGADRKQKFGPIFISYRRQDSAAFTHRTYSEIKRFYGTGGITFDIDSIPSGEEFRSYIVKAVQNARVFVAVIGKDWIGHSPDGPRLLSQGDFVRIEVEEALRRIGALRIIPVYVGGAHFPPPGQVPESLEPMRYINAIPVDDTVHYRASLRRLILAIDRALYPNPMVRHAVRAARLIKLYSSRFIIAALGLFVLFPPLFYLTYALRVRDPSAFQWKGGISAEIAHAIPDREALERETDTSQLIVDTHKTFDFYAERGNHLDNWQDDFRQIVRRGAHVRILLTDNYSKDSVNIQLKEQNGAPGDDDNTRSYYVHELSYNWRAIQNMEDQFAPIARESGGGFEFHVINIPYRNSIWVRDGRDKANGAAHIQVSFDGNSRLYPVFRIGNASPRMIERVQDEFDGLWARSYKPPRMD